MNVLTFTGNLGKDASVRQTGGSTVCGFSVAMKSGYGDKAQTIWVDVSVWGKQAEGSLPSYLTKGQSVAISGEMGTREYEGKTYVTCRANSIELIGKKDNNPSQQQQAPAQEQKPMSKQAPAVDIDEDDIPF